MVETYAQPDTLLVNVTSYCPVPRWVTLLTPFAGDQGAGQADAGEQVGAGGLRRASAQGHQQRGGGGSGGSPGEQEPGKPVDHGGYLLW